ncbi:MAG: hypothetical protein RL567_1207 [Bacteroidota bacterium]|jgi:YhcH/YjgK/YiaL family protein
MIVDKIYNWDRYFKNEIFSKIFEELKEYSVGTPNGTYRSNENYYFKVMSYDTKIEPTIIESHVKEVDVHVLLFGTEKIEIYLPEHVTISETYSTKTDCQFYNLSSEPCQEIILNPGYMAIFFSNDIHRPQIAVVEEIQTIKKIVIKIDEKLFT